MFDELKTSLADRPRRRLSRPKDAAVLVPIIDDGGPLRLLLTRRTDSLSTHKGHVAFPGGRIDPEDNGPTDAASPRGHRRDRSAVLRGRRAWLPGRLPTIHNDTAVTLWWDSSALSPSLARASRGRQDFTIPFDILTSPEGWRVEPVTRNGQTWPMIYCDYDGETLWGLSAYITMHLIEQITGFGPHTRSPTT